MAGCSHSASGLSCAGLVPNHQKHSTCPDHRLACFMRNLRALQQYGGSASCATGVTCMCVCMSHTGPLSIDCVKKNAKQTPTHLPVGSCSEKNRNDGAVAAHSHHDLGLLNSAGMWHTHQIFSPTQRLQHHDRSPQQQAKQP
jgi:hypothetical protein